MNIKQLERIQKGKGFVAALDQSGGSTPKALKSYGIDETRYHNEEEMYDLIQAMRSRIITSPAFTSEHILAAILFEKTMSFLMLVESTIFPIRCSLPCIILNKSTR